MRVPHSRFRWLILPDTSSLESISHSRWQQWASYSRLRDRNRNSSCVWRSTKDSIFKLPWIPRYLGIRYCRPLDPLRGCTISHICWAGITRCKTPGAAKKANPEQKLSVSKKPSPRIEEKSMGLRWPVSNPWIKRWNHLYLLFIDDRDEMNPAF